MKDNHSFEEERGPWEQVGCLHRLANRRRNGDDSASWIGSYNKGKAFWFIEWLKVPRLV